MGITTYKYGVRGSCTRDRGQQGQMTVELAVSIPVMLSVALVVCNVMLFMVHCASFDRLAKEAVRVYASAPAYGQSSANSAAIICASLQEAFPEDYLDVSVEVEGAPFGFVTYVATLSFSPTLFGRPVSGDVFDVHMARIEHTTQLTIDPYKPGVFA